MDLAGQFKMEQPHTDRMMRSDDVTRRKASAADILPGVEVERGVCALCEQSIVRPNGGIWRHETFTPRHPATPTKGTL